ncbi:MAG: SusC/RagA family TonB-linked outer membrane protein [Bacteroidetes bacterium]|nr:SusC/RagA family TonB-linked outer membrane protein [Bacteroidota bacterium]
MRLTAFILLVSVLHVSAAGVSQTVTLTARNEPMDKVLATVKTQTGYFFFYKSSELRRAKPVTIRAEGLSLAEFLRQVFRDQPLEYSIENQTVFIRARVEKPAVADPNAPLPPPPVTLRGEVRDSAGIPLEGATVRLVPGSALTVTDKDGVFVLPGVNPGRYMLEVSFVGFETYRKTFVASAETPAFVVGMKHSVSNLYEITVLNNGYQTLSRERSAGSFSKANMEVVNDRSTSMNIIQRLDGLMPGLVINNAPGANSIIVRGLSTINAGRSLLYVIDGVVASDASDVNPNDVQDVTLLKDATAASIWGSRASNGVIVITTKKGTRGGKLKVEYNGFVNLMGKPDIDYLPYMRSPQYIQTMKDLFADPAYINVNTYASANITLNGANPISPHEQILYRQYRGVITAAQADAQLDSLASLDNLQQIKDIWYRNASLMNHTIGVRGGTNNYSIYGSLAYTNTVSNTPGEKNNQYKMNLRQDVYINKNISAYIITNLVNTITSSGRPASVTNRFIPYQMFRDASGNSISMPWLYRTDSLTAIYQSKSGVNLDYNPIDEMDYGNSKSNTFHANITAGVTVRLYKGLRFEGVYGIMNGTSKSTDFDSQKSFTVRNQLAAFTVPSAVAGGAPTYYLPSTGGRLVTTNLFQRNWTVRNQLVYDFTSKNNQHQLTMLGGQEATSAFTNSNTSTARGYDPQLLTSQGVDYNVLANGINGTVFPASLINSRLSYDAYTESESDLRTTSWYGNAAYTYLHKYTVNGSIRNDHSPLFGKDKSAQNRPVWSAGLAWQMGKESFMSAFTWLDYLTLRATYGLSGNQPANSSVSSYDIYSGFTNTAAYGGTSLSISSYANRRLSWESTKTINFGIDFSVLQSRLLGSIDLYSRKTDGLIGSTPANPFTGVATITGNLGDISNKGIETRLTSMNVNTRNFSWSTTLVLSYNINKVTKLYVGTPTTSAIQQMGNRYVAGYAAFTQFAYKFIGLDTLGDPLIQLADKTITKAPGALAKDLVNVGSFQPDLTGGFSNTFRYRRFQLSMNAVYAFGSKLERDAIATTASLTGRTSPNPGIFTGNLYREFADRWKVKGDETKTNMPSYVASPSISSSRRNVLYYANGDVNYFDGAYIKMRDINLSYSLPASVISRLHAEEIAFRVTVSNILLWTANHYDIDPEFHNSGTAARTIPTAQHSITIGANIRF